MDPTGPHALYHLMAGLNVCSSHAQRRLETNEDGRLLHLEEFILIYKRVERNRERNRSLGQHLAKL